MRRLLNLRKRKEKGFTLVEMLLSTTISFIGVSAGFIILSLGYEQLDFGRNATKAQRQAGFALERMVRELKETGIRTINPDQSNIDSEAFATDIISFASARDDDNNFLTDDDGMPDWINAVVYFRDEDSNILYKYKEAKNDWSTNYSINVFNPLEASGKEQIAHSVTDIKFWFSGDRLLNIKITVSLNSETEDSCECVLTTQVKIRN
jgi:type II secretory pathway pseudopilin PulG